jgi:hypothetical protein
VSLLPSRPFPGSEGLKLSCDYYRFGWPLSILRRWFARFARPPAGLAQSANPVPDPTQPGLFPHNPTSITSSNPPDCSYENMPMASPAPKGTGCLTGAGISKRVRITPCGTGSGVCHQDSDPRPRVAALLHAPQRHRHTQTLREITNHADSRCQRHIANWVWRRAACLRGLQKRLDARSRSHFSIRT